MPDQPFSVIGLMILQNIQTGKYLGKLSKIDLNGVSLMKNQFTSVEGRFGKGA